ncbi:hypothetical protein RDABS01_024945, partial [Bienertia sinuspersici]
TTNEAEYEAAIAGLQLCLSTGAKKVCLRTDSQLVAHQYRRDYEVRESALVQYLSKMKQLASQLQSFTVELVPRGENVQADALSRLVSSTLQDLKRSVFVEVLPRRSTETNGEYVYQTGPPSQWMTEIIAYKTTGALPNEKTKARKVKLAATRVQGYQAADNDRVLDERLDLLEEVREQAALRMQAFLGKVARHYNR